MKYLKVANEDQYFVSKDQYIDSIFDKLPSNAIINKGRCGIGGTTLEIETNRDSIIVVPTIGVINSKCSDDSGYIDEVYKSKPKIFGIYGQISEDKLIAILEDQHPIRKIFTTPAGLRKLMECGYDKELIKQNWFLLLDEYHTSATDAFRNDILIPFDYFWIFPEENRAMISATPYKFSDPRISELKVYDIKITEKLGTVDILHTESVSDCLGYFLRNADQLDGNLHVFFNSVNEIANILRAYDVSYRASIYIANKEANMVKLDELRCRFHHKPSEENFSKINFYTSRYFEGWDLIDKNPTVIIVTDTKIATTKLGIRNKAFQAVGRSRNPIDRIIHITDHRNKKERETFKEIKRQHIKRAKSVVKGYNSHVKDSTNENFKVDKLQKEAAEKYSIIDKVNNTANYNSYLIDQFINQEYCDQDYNHIDYIKQAWEKMNFETKPFLLNPDIPKDGKLSPMASKIKYTVDMLEIIENNSEALLVNRYSEIKELLSENAIEWIDAYHIIGKNAIIDTKYSATKIRKLVIEEHNLEQEGELKKRILALFPKGTYSNDSVKSILHRLNTELGIKNPDGIYKPGKIKDLEKYFKIKPDGTSIKIGREKYEAEFGRYIFTVDGEEIRKRGFRVY